MRATIGCTELELWGLTQSCQLPEIFPIFDVDVSIDRATADETSFCLFISLLGFDLLCLVITRFHETVQDL